MLLSLQGTVLKGLGILLIYMKKRKIVNYFFYVNSHFNACKMMVWWQFC